MLTSAVGLSFAVAGMPSAAGRCHIFDARADGYVRGEACGAAVLQPAAGSVAVVRGSAVRQDGRSASLTAPNGTAQRALLQAALAEAGVAASLVARLEAHGTGTALGDPIEAGSLHAALLQARGEAQAPLALGSVKANYAGHAEPAAAMAGLLECWCLPRGSRAGWRRRMRSCGSSTYTWARRCTLARRARYRPAWRRWGEAERRGWWAAYRRLGTAARSRTRCCRTPRAAARRHRPWAAVRRSASAGAPFRGPSRYLRASCVHRWTPHRTRRLALTRAHPPLSLRAPRMTPHGPVDHALRHSIEKQSSRGRRAQHSTSSSCSSSPSEAVGLWWQLLVVPQTRARPGHLRRHPALVFLTLTLTPTPP